MVISAPENDPNGPVVPRRVEEVFTRIGRVIDLRVAGRSIRTTHEHPFHVEGKGWTQAAALLIGDLLRGHDGRLHAVESTADTFEDVAVYNMRIAEYHTYFVDRPEWNLDVWAHNADYFGGASADVPLQKQLAGKGQLRDLRANPNLKGVDVDALLKKTPAQIQDMVKRGEISPKTLKQLKKAFEGRDLGRRKG